MLGYMNMNKIKVVIITIIIIAFNIGCDQITKDYARKHLAGKGTIEVIGSIMVVRYAENDGAFLGMGSDIPQPFKTIILTVFPMVVIASAFFFVIFCRQLSIWELVFISCIIGGGISNLHDRIIYDGFVTDFLNFGIGRLRTGILNLADVSITFGAMFLLVTQYVKSRRTKKITG